MLVEDLHELGEVGERARQAVDLVDDDDVDLPRPNLLQQRLAGPDDLMMRPTGRHRHSVPAIAASLHAPGS